MLAGAVVRSEEHTSELQSHEHLVCRLLLEKKKNNKLDRCAQRVSAVQCVERVHYHCALTTTSMTPSPYSPRSYVFSCVSFFFFFFNDPAPPEIYPLPLHDALPI